MTVTWEGQSQDVKVKSISPFLLARSPINQIRFFSIRHQELNYSNSHSHSSQLHCTTIDEEGSVCQLSILGLCDPFFSSPTTIPQSIRKHRWISTNYLYLFLLSIYPGCHWQISLFSLDPTRTQFHKIYL